jgi:hypothetical protein
VKGLPRAGKPLPMKVLYSTMELARAIGITRHMFLELARKQDIVTYRLDRATLIPLSEIKEKLEPVWEAILLHERNRR